MNARMIIRSADPFTILLLASRKQMGTVINRVPQEAPAPQVHPLDRDKATCAYVEVDAFGTVTKRCFHKVFMGRTGFLCKMHNDLNVQMKPQRRTITSDDSDWGELKLRNRLQLEVRTERAVPSYPAVDYQNYVQWGWSRQPTLFVEDRFGAMVQAFSDPADFEDE